MTTTLDQILVVFRTEVTELLDSLAQTVESLPPLAPANRREPVDRCLRIAHNIKGIAATIGVQPIRELAHATETALTRLKEEPDLPVAPACSTLLAAVTAMHNLAEDRPCDEGERLALVARLRGEAPAAPTAAAATAAAPAPPGPAPAAPEHASPAADRASVRVESSRLDRMMTFAGELLATHSRLGARAEVLHRLEEDLRARLRELEGDSRAQLSPVVRELDAIIEEDRRELAAFGRLTRDLSAAMKQVRMMPLAGLAPLWRQLVRESGQQLARKVELLVDVGEIEVDKYVLDRIRDPLIHLLRNAVAHGIEPAPERAAKGKPETGRVVMRASLQGPLVRLQIGDDGRGLDPRRIGEAALRRGRLDAARLARLSREEVLSLIFEEGFSTSESVGQVSGRGVGLNVVKAQVAELGGELGVSPTSAEGGACFELLLPVTVVSRKGLLVRAGTSTYALPIEHVLRTQRAELRSLEQVGGEPVQRVDGEEPLRLRWLSQLMGRSAERGSDRVKVVVLEKGAARLGLVVDEVLREEEYVIKRLPANLAGVAGVDGAIILADGALAVALNVPELFQRAAARLEGAPATAAAEAPERSRGGPKRRMRILVVDDVLTVRAMHRSILEAAGHEVGLAVDGEDAWQALQREPFDAVVSDVQMPRLDGCALTARIRGDPKLRDLPVILVTALGDPEEIAAGGRAGANEYLVKGRYESERLLAAVRRFA
ncbi:MAG TPA: response regulator [Myxococcales bacterium]|jgi:two-component system chemotaxis sensor kinase CheA